MIIPGTVAPVADERQGLLAYLAQQRYVLRLSASGLTDAQARTRSTASTLTFPLMAAAEGWPVTPWLQPWQAPATTPG